MPVILAFRKGGVRIAMTWRPWLMELVARKSRLQRDNLSQKIQNQKEHGIGVCVCVL